FTFIDRWVMGIFFFKQKTAYEIGLGIPAEPLFRSLPALTLMRPSLVLFLVLWLKLVKDFLKVRCRLALLPFLISCLIWLDLVAKIGRASCRERVEIWVVGGVFKKKLSIVARNLVED